MLDLARAAGFEFMTPEELIAELSTETVHRHSVGQYPALVRRRPRSAGSGENSSRKTTFAHEFPRVSVSVRATPSA